ncbi:DUF6421 family protein, partial [Escherichia coli]|uniref:DUF6421 family protein n=1 Tax=Escherichia coli TaxID=562 RepID=UPI0032E51518
MTEILTTPATGISAGNQDWLRLKAAATALQSFQDQDGSISETAAHGEAAQQVDTIVDAIRALAPHFPHDADYLD